MGRKKKEEASIDMIEGQKKALDTALEHIQKKYGKGAVMRLDDSSKLDIEAIPTGSISLDIATGIGGVPKGRVVELFGPESGGKTTLALHIAAEAQKAGGTVAFIDAEHALDPSYARKIGVDTKTLLISQPDSGEQALEICSELASSGAVSLIVVDSVAALTPDAEIRGEMGDSHVALQARLMSQALRKITSTLGRTKTTVIFINQLREKVGIMFGNPETTPGGRALKFFSSMRIEIRKIDILKNGDKMVGNHVRAKIVKNKVAPPFRTAEFDIRYGTGIDKFADILECAVNYKIVEKSGAWYRYDGDYIGQGKDKAVAFLKDNEAVREEIENKINEAIITELSEEEDTLKVDEDGVVIDK